MKRGLRLILLFAMAALAGAAASEAIYRLSRPAAAAIELVAEIETARELDFLRAQFGDDELFRQALAASHLSLGEIREEIVEHLRARSRIEKQILPQLGATKEEARQFYAVHETQFQLPQRYRASHLFLAAPVGSAPELIAGKRSAIQGLAVRLLAGESLAKLAAEASEDEATKGRGGDVGFFAATRVPPEFFAEMEKLQPGSISAPFRSHLGFHIVQLSEARPPGRVTFEQAQPEVAITLENAKRAAAVSQLSEHLSRR